MSTISGVHIIKARMALGLSQREIGETLGVVKRTVQRWESGGATVLPQHVATLVTAVHARDPSLAAQIARNGDTSLLELGLERPPPPPSPPLPAAPPLPPPLPPLPTSTLVDSIVCVAADAVGMPPRAIRPALTAAFVRAREVRLDVGAVADSLTGDDGTAKGAAMPRARRR
jgi:DNA-binding XRE family transcriptional regulator